MLPRAEPGRSRGPISRTHSSPAVEARCAGDYNGASIGAVRRARTFERKGCIPRHPSHIANFETLGDRFIEAWEADPEAVEEYVQAIEELYGLGPKQMDLHWFARVARLLWLCAAGGVVALSAPAGAEVPAEGTPDAAPRHQRPCGHLRLSRRYYPFSPAAP